jgi:hypothetical protein
VKLAHSYSNREETVEGVDTVVLATGSYSESSLFDALRGKVPELHILGDAYAPRRWTFATQQALELAQAL